MTTISYKLSGILLTLLTVILISCKDDETLQGNGITEQEWVEGQTYTIPAGKEKTVAFTAKASWIAQSSSTALVSLNKNSGGAGKNTLIIRTHNSSDKEAIITIRVSGYSTKSSFKVKIKINEEDKDREINDLVNNYLKEKYLWNEEYKTLTPDFTLAYDDFVKETLGSMRTNNLDKKVYQGIDGKIYYSLYSYIRKLDPDLRSNTRAGKDKIEKEKEYSYGFVGLQPVQELSSSKWFFVIQGVHPGSSADQAGLKRGMEIHKVGGESISTKEWKDIYISLIAGDSRSTQQVTDKDGRVYNINSGPIEVNPVIYSHVKNNHSHRIGYLVYSKFDAGFDQELFDVFKKFKKENITDLILDLRYNGGGHVISAQLISSCIAGSAYEGEVFSSYRYNEERMKAIGNKKKTDPFLYSTYKNLNTSLAEGAVNLSKVYCLVSGQTASASELVINSLRGIDIEVILIGERTNGKNVGMEGTEFTTKAGTYEFFPITFQSYNAKDFGAYENGFDPDHIINENNPRGREFEGYKEFGAEDEPLYGKAISLITGKPFRMGGSTRSAIEQPRLTTLPVPETRQIGMIK
ncbi:S41 family peptidase [Bacteroides pyogenes]|uniref:S41 family peptidase n=1 Tax=Bacteroides pyogenes TaxID=310300 RepID=UPI0003DCA556|nr:S41 family peptidase [Bacteroides pyogenes]MBB3894982.1 C-terminal processing protease CtpA/Prc [Bacteroides pyogenes]GAE22616.1 carboxyl-terminal protease [Bacteroides pyogenes JCM 10003]SUV33321.1 carboxyl-terminal protease [Bacteroides pyogenes]